jgi:hypothetical protein
VLSPELLLQLLVERLEILSTVCVTVHVLNGSIILLFGAILGCLLLCELLLMEIFLPVTKKTSDGKFD